MISAQVKNEVLNTLAGQLKSKEKDILAANAKDVAAYQGQDLSMLDRLKVNASKVHGMIRSVHETIGFNDPEDVLLYTHQPENGLNIENRTVPFGLILIIYESRPDVTIEATITAFKAGNKILLKGGKEARHTNLVLTDLWHLALAKHGISQKYVTYLDIDREATQALIKNNANGIDLIIPRGGEGLINFVKSNTDIPILVSGRGNNFLYIDEDCDFDMAINIILDGKKRISVCNALDKVLIHQGLIRDQIKMDRLVSALHEEQIQMVGDTTISERHKAVLPIEHDDIFYEEFLAKKILLSEVESLALTIEKINTYSGKHSACIVTTDMNHAKQFMREVDCAAVYHNASTRFTDGGQFGFGAEMAISTQKVHFRGPIGVDQLVTNKWFVFGSGQVRS